MAVMASTCNFNLMLNNKEISQTNCTKNNNICLPTVATVSSLPWVKTTTRCLFLFTLGRFWALLAISAMSSVCEDTNRPNGLK